MSENKQEAKVQKKERERFFRQFAKELEEYAGEEYIIRYFESRGINQVPESRVSLRKKGKWGGWSIRLERLFESFQKGVPVKELVMQVMFKSEATNATDAVPDSLAERFESYEDIREYLCIQLMDMEKNEDFLKGKLFFPFLDLAVAVCFVIEQNADTIGTMCVPEEMLEEWGVPAEKVLGDVTMNTMERFPPIVLDATDRVDEMMEQLAEQVLELLADAPEEMKKELQMLLGQTEREEPDGFEQYMNPPEQKPIHVYFATNEQCFRGAGVILYPGFLKAFAEEQKVEKLLLLPSSLHEVVILTEVERCTVEECNEIIEGVNRTIVKPEDYLSNHAYLYDLV